MIPTREFDITGDTGPVGSNGGPTGPTASYPSLTIITLAATASDGSLTLTSTGDYTTTFNLGFGPTATPDETLVIQGIQLDQNLNASFQGMTAYQNGGLYTVKATYTVLGLSGRGTSFPYVPTQIVYYGTYQFT